MFPFNFYLSKLNLVTRSIIIKRLLSSSSSAAATAEGTADGKQTNRNYFPHRLDQRPTNEKSESSNEPPKPPEPPKSFHEKYLRRPLFGYPLKGNKVYSEINHVFIKIAGAMFGVFLIIIFSMKYYYDNIMDPERRERLYKESEWSLHMDKEYTKFTALLSTVSLHSQDITRFSFGEMKPGAKVVRTQKGTEWNPDNIIDPLQVYNREDSGRKTIFDYDEMLKKETENKNVNKV